MANNTSKIFNRNVVVSGGGDVDSEAGYKVNGTSVINSDREVSATNISGTSATLESITLSSSSVIAPYGTIKNSNGSVAMAIMPASGLTSAGGTRVDLPFFETSGTKSGAGAISTSVPVVLLTTTGADALTLADGIEGQVLRILMVVDGGNGTLTPTTKLGYSTITFNDAGDTVTLMFVTGRGWMILSNNGCTVA